MRLFVALDIPDAVRQALGDLIARLKPDGRGARWVRTEAMHLTLKFLGEVEAKKLDDLRAALATIGCAQPVQISYRGVGFFPSERSPRVVWCGVEATSNLTALAADVERALEPLGYPPETRPFVPHLTLARFSSHKGIEKIVRAAEQLESYTFGSARETEFFLYESVLKHSGAEYKRLAIFPFVKGAM